jgi:hypothetical protein
MNDITKNISDKIEHFEKEGTPVRSIATCARLFLEKAYKTTVAAFSPVQAQNLYAERVNLAAVSLETFKKKNKVFFSHDSLIS